MMLLDTGRIRAVHHALGVDSSTGPTAVPPRGFVTLSTLGRGAFATVFHVRDSHDDRRYVMKLAGTPCSHEAREHLSAEARALHALPLPGVPRIRHWEERSSSPYILTEPSPHLESARPLGPSSPTFLWAVLRVAASIHDHGWVHGDLKPANAIVLGDAVQVIDFGCAHPIGVHTTEAAAVTPAYGAPERLRGGPSTPRTDVWSLACMLHEGWCGARPRVSDASPGSSSDLSPNPSGPGAHELRRPSAEDLALRMGSGVSPALRRRRAAVLAEALDPNPALRPSDASALLHRLTPNAEERRAMQRTAM